MEYFKFYIKENSGEYYNMPMDRYYDAEDDALWISFLSSDRNKIDEETFLILKKGTDSNEIVKEKARYKISMTLCMNRMHVQESHIFCLQVVKTQIELKKVKILRNTQ